MKNLSFVLNGVLFIAVAVLYYLHFTTPNSSSSHNKGGELLKDSKIAFINSDSVLKYYDYFNTNRKKLEARGTQMEQDIRNRAQSLQNDVELYQRTVNNMTFGQAKAAEEELGKKQQNLQMYQQSLSQELAIEEGKLNKELYDKITKFLKQYSTENNIQVVFKYDPTSDVLYGGEALDITKLVIEGLNASNIESDSSKSK